MSYGSDNALERVQLCLRYAHNSIFNAVESYQAAFIAAEKEAERQRERANREAIQSAALEEAVGRFLAYCSEESLNDNGPIQALAEAIEPLRDWRKMDRKP